MESKISAFFLVGLASIFISPSGSFQSQAQKSEKTDLYPKVTIQGTEQRHLKSKYVDQDYQLQIYLPPNYATSIKSYPVLYLLDADKSFGMAKDIVEWLMRGRKIPEMMIVGVAYEEGDKLWWDKRSRDFTPSKDSKKVWGDWPLAGGAAKFKGFIEKELIPFIEGHYRALPNDRTIAGLSFGGLFATYILVTQPELFYRYILSGAALIWDDRIVFKFEEEFSQNNDTLPAIVYSAVGEFDDPATIIQPWKDFSAVIEKRNYKKLELMKEVISGETHLSAWPSSFTRGLQTVFAKK